MSTFGITARFPLGTYVGHRADGRIDDGPDPARLHAALVHAGYTGSTATIRDGKPNLSPEARTALTWLEEHPPCGIHVPVMRRQHDGVRIAYRKEGLFNKEARVWKDKTTARAVSDGWSLAGEFGWSWNDTVPEPIQETLSVLCEDVSCLGESHSPVVLECGEVRPNWVFSPEATRFTPGGIRVRIAAPGRLEALDEAADAARPKKKLSVSADKHLAMGSPLAPPVASKGLEERRYISPLRPQSGVPWTHAVLIFIDEFRPHDAGSLPLHRDSFSIPGEDRVRWCVALHRALAKRIGEMAPPLITGKFGPEVRQPANRIALQVLDSSVLALSEHADLAQGRSALAVMIPRESANDDVLVLHQALQGFRTLNSRFGRASVTLHREPIRCDEFWRDPALGTVRLWAPVTSVVPEGRRGSGISLGDSVVQSIGYLLRDLLPEEIREANRATQIAELKKRGVRTFGTRLLPVDASRHVHRFPQGMVPQPVTSMIDLSAQLFDWSSVSDTPISLPPQTLFALGQSRHLGGGLLAPVDLPLDVARGLLGGAA